MLLKRHLKSIAQRNELKLHYGAKFSESGRSFVLSTKARLRLMQTMSENAVLNMVKALISVLIFCTGNMPLSEKIILTD